MIIKFDPACYQQPETISSKVCALVYLVYKYFCIYFTFYFLYTTISPRSVPWYIYYIKSLYIIQFFKISALVYLLHKVTL
jgi:hypothetical protein